MLKYRGLYERYRVLIAEGTYGPGERMPSLRGVALAEGLGLNTVRSAFDLLERDGLVRPLPRGGFYVRGRSRLADYEPPGDSHEAEGLSAAGKIEYILQKGGSSASFALAEPDPRLLPVARLERLHASLGGSWIEYGDQTGEPELRRRLTATYHPYHADLRPETILVTGGATEALGIAFRTFVARGDAVVVEAPAYFNFFRQLSAQGARIVEIPVLPGRGMDLDLLEAELKKQTIRMIVAQPNVQNPTGATMSDADKERLVALASRHGVLLLQDDVYGDLSFTEERPANLSLFGRHEGMIYVSSFSKTLAPGLRMGFMHAPALQGELARTKGLASLATGRPAQRVLAGFLAGSSYRRHLRQMRAALEVQLADYLEVLEGALPPGSSVAPPAGGCLLWAALPRGTDASEVFEAAAREGILCSPGELFSANPFFRGHLRVNFGYRLTEARRRDLLRLCEIAAEAGRGKRSGKRGGERGGERRTGARPGKTSA
jgi:DNA-binding transcriptional MocR family regulator